MRPRYVPLSTYRLQVHREFPFSAATGVVAYLARLGIGGCYSSPYFTAAPGSTHGYDVCNHNEINPELGGVEQHAAFIACLREQDLGHVLDFVPNHMGIGTGANTWWRDVLENGPDSPAARFFDIDWTPIKAELHAKLLLPILGDQYGKVLENGDLRLRFADGALTLHYFEHELPINPRHSPRVYRRAVEPLTALLGADNPQLHELQSIISSLENMPAATGQNPDAIAERQREKEVARSRLARLTAESPAIRSELERAVAELNGERGRPETFDALHELLELQAYRLSYWRTASHEINYRRFFDINTLVGLRVEDPEVFTRTHGLLAELIRSGSVNGLRIDHPDGLFDPARYFEMLQDLAAAAWGVERAAGEERPCRPMFVVAEKILSGRERLPRRWAVHGTSGYNFLNDLNGLFISVPQARRMRRGYAKLTGQTEAFDQVLYESKRLIMETAMASELNVLAHMLDRIAESNRRSRDFTRDSLRSAISEVVASFPVYRTYVDESGWTPEDRTVVVQAVAMARRRNPAMEQSLFDFLLEVILPRVPTETAAQRAEDRRGGYPPANADEARERFRFAMKLQQYTGPVQAKGLEDTAFYRYNLLLSLNEVGGDPARFGRALHEFHESCRDRLRQWPFEMLATATHDTKHGEDVRARINVLSEIPDEWSRSAARWMRLNKAHRTMVDGEPAPDRNDEYRYYQALLGIWPPGIGNVAEAPADLIERIRAYMLKAVKEAKRHTSWLSPNEQYEAAVHRFVQRTLAGPGAARFLGAFLPFQHWLAEAGMVNSLAQTATKICAPGVPDFYQGAELWDFSLVDPDNRRPVDFQLRERLLAELESLSGPGRENRCQAAAHLVKNWHDGRIKLLLTTAGLRLRKELPDVFLDGEYVPLKADMTVDADLIAFARVRADDVVVMVAPRLATRIMAPCPAPGSPFPGEAYDGSRASPLGASAWKTSRVLIPEAWSDRTFVHVVTGAKVRPVSGAGETWLFVGQLFETVPAAILRRVDGKDK